MAQSDNKLVRGISDFSVLVSELRRKDALQYLSITFLTYRQHRLKIQAFQKLYFSN